MHKQRPLIVDFLIIYKHNFFIKLVMLVTVSVVFIIQVSAVAYIPDLSGSALPLFSIQQLPTAST